MNTPAAQRWEKLSMNRSAVLNRARACAAVTIPSLLPPEGTTENDQLKTPYQSVGARAVDNLASKLVLTLYPPNSPYFRVDVAQNIIEALREETGDEQIESKIKEQLARIEDLAVQYHESKADRVTLFEALRLLIVTGDVLLFQDPGDEHKLRYFRMDQYCIRRSPSGKPIEIIVREHLASDEIPQGIAASGASDDRPVPIYTYAKREGDKWTVYQEVLGQIVPGSEGTFNSTTFPFIPIAWTLHPGDNYGRGHVEENLGDFLSLEGLRKSFLEGAAALAKLVFLINPNGLTKKNDIMRVPNGGFAVGRREDITTLQADKMADLQFVQSEIIRLEASISKAFLLAESIRRDAERVTAEEIRMMASDLDDTLGGIYTRLSQDLQRPLLVLRMEAMRKEKRLPPLPEGIILTITTGFEALGRGHELMKLQQFLMMLEPLGPAVIQNTIQLSEYARRVATGLGLNIKGLVPSDEELQQMMQQREIMAMMQKLMPLMAEKLTEAGAINTENIPAEGGGL